MSLITLSNTCSWCIIKPLENCIFGVKIFSCSCEHIDGKDKFKANVSLYLIVIFASLTSFMLFLVWYFGNKAIYNNNQILLMGSYALMSLTVNVIIAVPVLCSKYRVLDLKSISTFLQKSRLFGIEQFFQYEDTFLLRRKCVIYGCLVVFQPLYMFFLYIIEVYIKGSVNHIEKILAIITNYVFYSIVFQSETTLYIYEKMHFVVCLYLKKNLLKRTKSIYNRFGRTSIEIDIPKLSRFFMTFPSNSRIYMRYVSLLLVLTVCMIPFVGMIINVLFWDTLLNFNKLSIDIKLTNIMYALRVLFLMPPIIHLLYSATNIQKPVSTI